MYKQTLVLILVFVLSSCTENISNPIDASNKLKPSWDAALECTNEKYAREKNIGWYQENYILLDRQNMKVFEFRAKLSTKKEGLLWASEYGGSERTLSNFDNEILKLSRYQWRGTGEWY